MPRKERIKKKREYYTQKEFMEWLKYDKENGTFLWKKSPANRIKIGTYAGCKNNNGYIHIIFDGLCFKAHRIAWLIEKGEWPSDIIDHIDGNKENNRISNLRCISEKENQSNRKEHREGILWGTTKIQNGKYYQARVHGKYLGNFLTRKEAHECAVYYKKGD